MKLSVRGFITPKQSESFKDCADRFAFNLSQQKFALSDGVSQSFFPGDWADILVKEWVNTKEREVSKIISSARSKWERRVSECVKRPETPWYTQNSFLERRPGLATFVGLRFYKNSKSWRWHANALGDSYLFFVPTEYTDYHKSLIKLSSNSNDEFDNYPDYIPSKETSKSKGEMQSMDREVFNGTFFIMSDALAEWFIKGGADSYYSTKTWVDQDHFEKYIMEQRLSHKLANDDNAVLIIEVEDFSGVDFDHTILPVVDIDEKIYDDLHHNSEIKEDEQKKKVLLENLDRANNDIQCSADCNTNSPAELGMLEPGGVSLDKNTDTVSIKTKELSTDSANQKTSEKMSEGDDLDFEKV